jgi:hypothetical protein
MSGKIGKKTSKKTSRKMGKKTSKYNDTGHRQPDEIEDYEKSNDISYVPAAASSYVPAAASSYVPAAASSYVPASVPSYIQTEDFESIYADNNANRYNNDSDVSSSGSYSELSGAWKQYTSSPRQIMYKWFDSPEEVTSNEEVTSDKEPTLFFCISLHGYILNSTEYYSKPSYINPLVYSIPKVGGCGINTADFFEVLEQNLNRITDIHEYSKYITTDFRHWLRNEVGESFEEWHRDLSKDDLEYLKGNFVYIMTTIINSEDPKKGFESFELLLSEFHDFLFENKEKVKLLIDKMIKYGKHPTTIDYFNKELEHCINEMTEYTMQLQETLGQRFSMNKTIIPQIFSGKQIQDNQEEPFGIIVKFLNNDQEPLFKLLREYAKEMHLEIDSAYLEITQNCVLLKNTELYNFFAWIGQSYLTDEDYGKYMSHLDSISQDFNNTTVEFTTSSEDFYGFLDLLNVATDFSVSASVLNLTCAYDDSPEIKNFDIINSQSPLIHDLLLRESQKEKCIDKTKKGGIRKKHKSKKTHKSKKRRRTKKHTHSSLL